jgi:heterodisulfide reductase subunit C
MAIVIEKVKKDYNLLQTVGEISGVDVHACLQCKKCSNGCPVSSLTNISPSGIIRMLQLGLGNEILDSDLVWMCASCETCFSRCPMKIDMASVMDALRTLSVSRRSKNQKENVQLFNKSFLNSVRRYGRTYDLGMIASYKMATSSYLKDTDKFPMMLRKGKIALLPSFKGDKQYINRIFKRKDKQD